jgi:hypothetical protein
LFTIFNIWFLVFGVCTSILQQGRPFFLTFFVSNDIHLHWTDASRADDLIRRHLSGEFGAGAGATSLSDRGDGDEYDEDDRESAHKRDEEQEGDSEREEAEDGDSSLHHHHQHHHQQHRKKTAGLDLSPPDNLERWEAIGPYVPHEFEVKSRPAHDFLLFTILLGSPISLLLPFCFIVRFILDNLRFCVPCLSVFLSCR